jgi:hypothetical protein
MASSSAVHIHLEQRFSSSSTANLGFIVQLRKLLYLEVSMFDCYWNGQLPRSIRLLKSYWNPFEKDQLLRLLAQEGLLDCDSVSFTTPK